jgi:hypothetical protein
MTGTNDRYAALLAETEGRGSREPTPDPPMAPEAPGITLAELSTDMSANQLVAAARRGGSFHGTDPGAARTLIALHEVNPAAAVQLIASDIAGRQRAADEALAEATGVDGARVRHVAKQHGVDEVSARSIAAVEQELDALDADAEVASDTPWLDGRELSTPPEPWNEVHWQRDRLRAEAHGLTLDQVAWRVHAEQGQDAVHEMLSSQREQRRKELGRAHLAALEEGKIRVAAAAENAERERQLDAEIDAKLSRQVGHPSFKPPR